MAKQLVYADPKFYGTFLTIPHDGTVKLGPNGEVSVSEKAAEALLTVEGWSDPTVKPKKKAEIPVKEKKEATLSFEEDDAKLPFSEDDLANLDRLDLNELLEVASVAGVEVPAPMKTEKGKKGLIALLRTSIKKKLSAQ